MKNWKDKKLWWHWITLAIVLYLLPPVVFGFLVGYIHFLGNDIIQHFTWIFSFFIVLVSSDILLRKVMGKD